MTAARSAVKPKSRAVNKCCMSWSKVVASARAPTRGRLRRRGGVPQRPNNRFWALSKITTYYEYANLFDWLAFLSPDRVVCPHLSEARVWESLKPN
jgi:hypothetical protein